MKEILRQLLEAEEAGRQAAAQLAARGELLLHEAQAESESIIQKTRSDTKKQMEQMERQARVAIEQGRRAIASETEATIERLRIQATRRGPVAVQQVVSLLLDELPAAQGER